MKYKSNVLLVDTHPIWRRQHGATLDLDPKAEVFVGLTGDCGTNDFDDVRLPAKSIAQKDDTGHYERGG